MKRFLLVFMCILPLGLTAQKDTLWLKNTNVLYGEIKRLSSGVLTMETPYSDDDFTIDYDEVDRMYIERQCVIIATGGIRMVGYIRSKESGQVTVVENGEEEAVYSLKYITAIETIESRFLDRFKANIDIGLNLTKANNLNQLVYPGDRSYQPKLTPLVPRPHRSISVY